MTSDEFKAKTGRAPDQDDLDRVNCPKVGQAGHQQCGWCNLCDLPRFQCSHIVNLSSPLQEYNIEFVLQGPAGRVTAPNKTNPVKAKDMSEVLMHLATQLPITSMGHTLDTIEVKITKL